MKKEQPNDNQITYTQQHLANERTYLAWIRTAIAIVGIGFLATSLHFTIGYVRNPWIDAVSVLVGVFSCILATAVIYITNKNFKLKREEILNGQFWPSVSHVHLLSYLMLIFVILIMNYFIFLIWT